MVKLKMIIFDNKEYPKFSVAMCVYRKDNPEHFRKALESVYSQTVMPDEVVLVVDGPVPEEIEKVIDFFRSEYMMKVEYLEKNVGHGEARKIGLKKCTNKLVALMDADDIAVMSRFQKQLEEFQKDPELSIVGGNIKEFIGNVDNIAGVRKVPEEDKEIKKYLKRRCPFNQMTVMFNAEDVERAGGYKHWHCNEDYFLWIRMHMLGLKFKNIQDCLVLARSGEEMYGRRGGWKYFLSEAKLQKFMKDNKIIGWKDFSVNVAVRFVVQVIMTNGMRGMFFKKIARERG